MERGHSPQIRTRPRMGLEALQALGWAEKELPRRRKGDKGKVKLARLLRTGTNDDFALGCKWGKHGSLASLLRDARKRR